MSKSFDDWCLDLTNKCLVNNHNNANDCADVVDDNAADNCSQSDDCNKADHSNKSSVCNFVLRCQTFARKNPVCSSAITSVDPLLGVPLTPLLGPPDVDD